MQKKACPQWARGDAAQPARVARCPRAHARFGNASHIDSNDNTVPSGAVIAMHTRAFLRSMPSLLSALERV
jgi:hypothetical protein